MPSKGRSEWNKTYYSKNAEDICYKRRLEWKEAKTIDCPCGEFSRYKDTTSARNAHFKTLTHRVWEREKDVFKFMGQCGYSQEKAKEFITERYRKKMTRTKQDQLIQLNKIVNECIAAIDGKGKSKPKPKPEPKPLNVVVEEPKPDEPHIPPSAAFDPMSLASSSD
jgi:hypothetical protein